MIAYRGVAKDGTLTASANDSIIDDLSFRLAYKLSYDANGGDKTDTSQIKASSDGTVKSIADKTSKVPVHDLEDTDVPGQYRDFILDTTKVKFSDVKFENGAWLNAPMPDSGDGATAMFPLKIGASATLPNVGEWTDGSGHTHSINAVISLHSWNGGSISQLWTPVEGKDLFWINTRRRNSDLPAQVIKHSAHRHVEARRMPVDRELHVRGRHPRARHVPWSHRFQRSGRLGRSTRSEVRGCSTGLRLRRCLQDPRCRARHLWDQRFRRRQA